MIALIERDSGLDGYLCKIKNDLNRTLHIKEKLGRACYLIEDDNGLLLVLKLQPPAVNYKNKIVRFIVGGSIPFTNEIKVNMALRDKQNKLTSLNFPMLMITDHKNYFIISYIDYLKETTLNELDNQKTIAKALVEFQLTEVEFNDTCIKVIIKNIMQKPGMKLLRILQSLFIREYGFKLSIKCCWLLIKCLFYSRSTNFPIFIHNDLDRNNVLLNEKNELFFIDFEDSIYEKKFIFVDIIDLAFNQCDCTISSSLINDYIHELRDNKVNVDSIDIKVQIRFALLRRLILLLVSKKRSESQKNMYKYFLEKVILNDQNYSEWYDLNLKNIIYSD